MRDYYGDFCSHHTEAVGYYKEQKQNNKKFHNVIRVRTTNALTLATSRINVKHGDASFFSSENQQPAHRAEVRSDRVHPAGDAAHYQVPSSGGAYPEQHRRSTSNLFSTSVSDYPSIFWKIVAQLFQSMFLSAAGTEEHKDLTRSLSLIKETIVQVDARVNVHEKNSRLRDIHNKMEPKALGKFKDGRVFRREDLAQGRRRLLHDGTVSWKAASGRLKGVTTWKPNDILLPSARINVERVLCSDRYSRGASV